MFSKSSGWQVAPVRRGQSGSCTLSDGHTDRVAASLCRAAPAAQGPEQVRLLLKRPESSPAPEVLQHQNRRQDSTASDACARSHSQR